MQVVEHMPAGERSQVAERILAADGRHAEAAAGRSPAAAHLK